ncbi:MAG: carbohydrate ABC transporter permease [Candidatus Gastranaerophilales bacterium]|nr:carbohydrate ABC transporter permease [Candidatus Gastranaerophilales bacterium]
MIKKFIHSIGGHTFLILMSFLSLFPFLWLISTAIKGADENIFQYPPVFFPKHITFENFIEVWNQIPFLRYFFNSAIVAGFTVILNLILSSAAAYPLARMEFKGKNFIFCLILATIMIPFQAIMLPVYLIILKLHFVDSYGIINGYIGLILPFAVNAFGIFLMRQAFLSIPKEIEEAAFIDGCSIFNIWRKILIPMCAPSLALLAIFTFIGSWGEFLWPGIVLTNKSLYTLPVGVNDLQGMFSANWRYIAAGSIISIIPIIIFFIAMQKYFVSGQNEGALKG